MKNKISLKSRFIRLCPTAVCKKTSLMEYSVFLTEEDTENNMNVFSSSSTAKKTWKEAVLKWDTIQKMGIK